MLTLTATTGNLVRGSLIVEVEDAVWQKQLFHLRGLILAQLSKIIGEGVVKDVEFRVAAPRRPPQQATTLGAAKPADEADGIADPVLRIVYKQARKKASA